MDNTLDGQDPQGAFLASLPAEITSRANALPAVAPMPKNPSSPTDNNRGERPLESHEVIELQTFSERQAWIEEKIKVNLCNLCF